MNEWAVSMTGCVVLRAGCGTSEPTRESTRDESVGGESTTYTIGMSQCNLGEPWRVQMNADFGAAADRYDDIQVVFKDAQNDTLKQRSDVEEFVSAGVDVRIISPREARPLTEPVAKAYRAGISVIVLDGAVLGKDVEEEITLGSRLFAADNVERGRERIQ